MTMLKLLELREPIERLCIQKALERQTENDRDSFMALHIRLRDTPNCDRPAFMAVLWDVHRAIATASQNEFIHTALRTTQGLSRRYWGHFADAKDQELAKAIYLALLEAMLAKDADAALGESQNLIRHLRELTLGSMQKLAGQK